MNCSICGKESAWAICDECVKEHNSSRTKGIWENNRETAEQLAQAYYNHVLKSYEKDATKDTKKNLGFNAFCDGINMSLDIIMPFLDDAQLEAVKKQINQMLELRKRNKKYG